MSPDAQWVIGIGLLIVLPLIGVVWTFLRKEIAAACAGSAKLEARFEQWIKDKERFDYEFRHNEYSTTITRINSDLFPLMKQAEEHDRRLNRLDSKVFNGHK